jgi:hypothetical protein
MLITSHFPQQCLYFLPLPQGQGSLRPTFLPSALAFGWLAARDTGKAARAMGEGATFAGSSRLAMLT